MANRSMVATPSVMRGWLKKQSRGGIIKNWRSRYGVLEKGGIKYFEKQSSINAPPYGEDLKGGMNLVGATLVGFDDTGSTRIYIVGSEGNEKDLLMEADNAEEAQAWRDAITEHTEYAARLQNRCCNRQILYIMSKRFKLIFFLPLTNRMWWLTLHSFS